jgi:hypothetical protein
MTFVYLTGTIQNIFQPCLTHFLAKATFEAIAKTYEYLTPDLWGENKFTKVPYQEFTDFLAKPVLPKTTPVSQAEQPAAPAGKGF